MLPHKGECWRNHTEHTGQHSGSSGAMEPQACLDLLTDLYNHANVIVSHLCCDDDSAVKAVCQWHPEVHKEKMGVDPPEECQFSGKHKDTMQPRGNKGQLPPEVPEPKFVADPNHRRKLLTGES